MKALNFKDWQKIASDGKTTTLKNKEGHTLTILHAKIPKIQIEQLKRLKMADGGDITPKDDVPEPNKENAKAMEKGATRGALTPTEMWANLKEGIGMADGGSVQAEGAPSDAEMSDASNDPGHDHSTTITINAAPAPSPMMMQPLAQQVPATASAPQYTGQGPAQGAAPVEVPSVPNVPNQNGPQGIAQMGQKAVTEKQNIDEAVAKNAAVVYDQTLQREQALQNQQAQHFNEVTAATNRFDNYVQSHPIDSKAIFKDMSVPQKILNAIGVFAGGFAAGQTGTGVNPAMQWLKDQQDKNIEAQKSRMHQQETAYGAYHQLYQDSQIADNLARVSYNNVEKKLVELQKAKLGTPAAQQAADAISADLNKDNYLKLGAAANRIGLIRSGQVQPDGAVSSGPQASLKEPLKKNVPPGQGPVRTMTAGNKQETFGNYHPAPILTPEATEKFNNLGVTAIITPEQKSDFTTQYNQAEQADRALAQLPDVMHDLADKATLYSYVQDNIHKLAPQGGGENLISGIMNAAASAGQLLPGAAAAMTDKIHGTKNISTDREYQSLKDRLRDIIVNGLKGANVSPTQLEELLNKNTPIYKGNDEENLTKLKTIERFIRNNARMGTLKARGAVNTP